MKNITETSTYANVKRHKARLQAIRESDADFPTKLTQASCLLEYLLEEVSRVVPDSLREDIEACLVLTNDIWTGKAQKKRSFGKFGDCERALIETLSFLINSRSFSVPIVPGKLLVCKHKEHIHATRQKNDMREKGP